jgi:multiple sugar transport system permease protein
MATSVKQAEGAVVVARGVAGRQGINWTPYLFILPHLIFFAVFLAYPFFSGLAISFLDYSYLRPEATRFVGLGNYINIFTPNTPQFQTFWNALGNTVQFVIYSVPLLVIIPLALAVLLNTKIPGRDVFRAIYFAPWVLSVAVVGLLWWWIFQDQGGLINHYLGQMGFTPPQWLSTMPWAWVSIVVATVWWTLGFNTIILLAGIQDIPDYLYEAGALDGATGLRAFRTITVPMLRSVLLFIIITSIIASFNLFGQPFIMTGGGPSQAGGGGATEPVMVRIYNEGFIRNFQGSAAAMSVLVAAIMILVSYLNFRFFRERD